MYATLLAQIGTTLGQIPMVKDHFFVPKTKLTAYPSVFYKPAGTENSFETNQDNFEVYTFLLLVIVGKGGTTAENAFGTVLPKVVDAIKDKFRENWNGGTIDGHRVWAELTSEDEWQVSDGEDGWECYAPLRLQFKLLASV